MLIKIFAIKETSKFQVTYSTLKALCKPYKKYRKKVLYRTFSKLSKDYLRSRSFYRPVASKRSDLKP